MVEPGRPRRLRRPPPPDRRAGAGRGSRLRHASPRRHGPRQHRLRGRRDRTGHRAPARGRSAAKQRRAGATAPEDGGRGTPGRRHRPRLQQSPDRHHGLQRAAAPRAGSGQSPAQEHGDHPDDRRPRRPAHPAAPGLQPQAGPRTHAAGPQYRRHRDDRHPPPADRSEHRARLQARGGTRSRQGRSRADRAGDRQSRRQRPGRHAGRRPDHVETATVDLDERTPRSTRERTAART